MGDMHSRDNSRRYCLGLYEKSMPGALGLPEKLVETKAAGFDYLELSIDETDEKLARLDWNDTEIRALRHAVEETGVPVYSICLSGHRRFPLGDPDPTVRERGLAIMEGAVSLAARLGARIIQLAGYDVYYRQGDENTRRLFAETWGAPLTWRPGGALHWHLKPWKPPSSTRWKRPCTGSTGSIPRICRSIPMPGTSPTPPAFTESP
jgi:hypothetical protein